MGYVRYWETAVFPTPGQRGARVPNLLSDIVTGGTSTLFESSNMQGPRCPKWGERYAGGERGINPHSSSPGHRVTSRSDESPPSRPDSNTPPRAARHSLLR